MRNRAEEEEEEAVALRSMLLRIENPMRNSICLLLALLLTCQLTHAQSRRTRARTASGNITGHYSVRNPSMENSLDVLLLRGGKVKIYLFASWIGSAATGNVNTGEIKTILSLKNRTVVYESGQCRIRIRFSGNKAIVGQAESNGDCGFGLNVSAEGTYKKRNSRAPKFDF